MTAAQYTRTKKGLYESKENTLSIKADDDGWSVLHRGEVLADGIPKLAAAKKAADKFARSIRRDPRAKLLTELAAAEIALAETPVRENAWYDPKGLDTGVRLKREFAVAWRRAVLACPEGKLTKRKARVLTGIGTFRRTRPFYVFAIDGKDQVAVCPSAGPDFQGRLSNLEGQAFNNYCQRHGWQKAK